MVFPSGEPVHVGRYRFRPCRAEGPERRARPGSRSGSLVTPLPRPDAPAAARGGRGTRSADAVGYELVLAVFAVPLAAPELSADLAAGARLGVEVRVREARLDLLDDRTQVSGRHALCPDS